MPVFRVGEAKLHHCGKISRSLRSVHRDLVLTLGFEPHDSIRRMFDDSTFRRAWYLDDRLGAVGGIVGSALSSRGFIWLAVAEEAQKHPLAMVREAKRQLDEISETKIELYTTVLKDDVKSMSFARRLGFVAVEEALGLVTLDWQVLLVRHS